MAKKRSAKKAKAAKKSGSAVSKRRAIVAKQEKFFRKAELEKIDIKRYNKPGEKTMFDVRIQSRKLGEAPKEYHFVLKSGEKLKSIQELAQAMETMGEDVFRHHVTDFRNDFAKWVNDVFNERKLAEELGRVKNKTETELKLLRHIAKKLAS